MRVLEVGPDRLAICADADGDRHEVMCDLVGDVRGDDEVLVHAGVALLRLGTAA
jgi:hydrogenase maturation factor